VPAQKRAQQWPEPVVPHIPESQSSFSLQAPRATELPHAPALQTKPEAQSLEVAQVE
jgi:hypothetical protein